MKVLKDTYLCVHGVLFVAGPNNFKVILKPLFSALISLLLLFLELDVGGAKGHRHPQVLIFVVTTSTQWSNYRYFLTDSRYLLITYGTHGISLFSSLCPGPSPHLDWPSFSSQHN